MGEISILPEPDHLTRLVTLVDGAFSQGGWHQPHHLLIVEPDEGQPGSFLLGQRTLADGEHPLDHLLGFTAPETWLAMGVVCFGWAAPADGVDFQRGTSQVRASRHPERRRVRVVALMDRSGQEHATAALDDGTVIDEPGQGMVTDALRRCFGLPTPPPPIGTAEFFAQVWLQAVVENPGARTWTEVAGLHPAMSWREGGRPPTVDELAEAGRALEAVASWEELRRSTARDGGRWARLVHPDLATWMDDGMFARWVLAEQPTIAALVACLPGYVSSTVLRRVRRAMQDWGLEAGGAPA